jgi:hypothetical protein
MQNVMGIDGGAVNSSPSAVYSSDSLGPPLGTAVIPPSG